MNSTSPSSTLVSKPARSPAFSIVGPLVTLEVAAHGLGEDVRQGGFARPRRADQKDVAECFTSFFCRCRSQFEPPFGSFLPNEILKRVWNRLFGS